jgi:nitrogen fixation NifU-like protein
VLDDLYREVILDHYRSPHHRGQLADPDLFAHGHNPVCGDEVTVQVRMNDGNIAEVWTMGNGCSISQASASIMTGGVEGKTIEEALALVGEVEGMMRGNGAPQGEGLDDLVALEGVKKFPARVKCALLGWETLKEAIYSSREK